MITQHRDGDVAVIEIDRHERRNALDTAHCHDLRAALTGQVSNGHDPTGQAPTGQAPSGHAPTGQAPSGHAPTGLRAARAIVVTGAGSSFCAGADLQAAYDAAFRDALYAMLAAVTEVTVPVIAAVNGPAIGAGAQLALACDLRVAAAEATFAIPVARLGIAVNPWTIRRLALLAGTGTAQAMLIGAETLDATAALRCGLASRRGDRGAALAWARELAGLAPLSLAYAKKAINQPGSTELAKDFDTCWASDDAAEGQRARAAKRPPRFGGR